jgi:predicted site-specific integrase-resolvase
MKTMTRFSTREAAKRLGISHDALATYVRIGKVPSPEIVQQGQRVAHIWTEEEIEQIRKLLPRIANGRKTRWQREKQKAQAGVPVPHKRPKAKKRK